jgi:hypothetical protein
MFQLFKLRDLKCELELFELRDLNLNTNKMSFKFECKNRVV